jgi:hypothetical protein
MFFLFLLGILVYLNSNLAKKKGLSPVLWGVITVVAFFAAFMVLGTIYVSLIYNGQYTREAMMTYFESRPLVGYTIILLGVGGTLLVRFILERTKGSTGRE